MADAIIIARVPGAVESRLARILEFFGLTCVVGLDHHATVRRSSETTKKPYVVFVCLDVLAEAPTRAEAIQIIRGAGAVYLYAGPDAMQSQPGLRAIEGWSEASLTSTGSKTAVLSVSADLQELDGAMSGVTVTAAIGGDDFVLTGQLPVFDTLLSIDDIPAFVRFEWHGVRSYLCASAAMVDIDRPLASAYFDVKEYFCSVVPLVMFVTSVFAGRVWRPFETGACLIIDDPLLKPTYGFCDFNRLLELMNVHDFTTNVAFIPWNWRRTSSSAASFFRRERRRFSVSIHGCDHTAEEFGETRLEALVGKASLAQTRMQRHQKRTGIAHDAVMVFPQGVFSSQSLGALKRSRFIAAVNTEVSPVDHETSPTLIRDVWDVAIMRHSSFPVFTRRYAFHGVENFAFDILLGKPCLIVAHHDFFRDDCAALLELVRRLHALRCTLTWRSLGDVVRHAGLHRAGESGGEEIVMYGGEFAWANQTARTVDVVVCKHEHDASLVMGVSGVNGALQWRTRNDDVVFVDTIPAGADARFSIEYQPLPTRPTMPRPIRTKASVAARRLLCEFRDEYWQKLVHG